MSRFLPALVKKFFLHRRLFAHRIGSAGLAALGFLAQCALVLLALGVPQSWAVDRSAWTEGADTTFHSAIVTSAPVNVFVRAPDGFLWLGMQDGLSRWDGYHQKRYSSDPTMPGALPSPDIQALHLDPRGTLWVGTAAGLARYDPVADHFNVPFKEGDLKDGYVHNIASDASNHLWVGAADGLHRVDLDTLRVHSHGDLAGRLGLPAGLVQALLVDRQQRLWAIMPQGLYLQPNADGRFHKVNLPQAGRKPAVATQIAQDSAGRIWVATASREIYLALGDDDGRWTRLKDLIPAATALLTAHGARTLCEVRPGEMWIATDDGILQVNVDQHWVRRAAHRERMAGSLPDDYVFTLYADGNGLVWMSTNVSVAYSVIEQRGLLTFWGRDAGPPRPAYSDVTQVLTHPNGTIWYGLVSGGIDIFSPGDGRVRHVRPSDRDPAHFLPTDRLNSLELGPGGSVYIGTRHGLYRADDKGGAVTRLGIPGRPDVQPVETLRFRDERLWLGGDDGLWGLRPAKAARMEVTAHLGPQELGAHTVWQIYPDEDGQTLWIGAGTGAMAVHVPTMSVKRLAPETANHLGVPRGHVTSILTDRLGRLWLGLYGLGVRIVDLHAPDGPRVIRRITKAEGLPHDGINQMLLDDAGDIWLSTDEGLARINAQDLQVTTFTAADGLGILGYWAGAGARTADGLLVFGGVNGTTVVDPRAVREPKDKPRLVVTEVRTGEADAAMAAPMAHGRLTIPPGQRALMVEYAVLDFAAPAENRYEYRLQGLDRTWKSTPPDRRLAAYTNLPPGQYVLELRGADRHKRWTATTEIPVDVPPAWHETVWLKLAIGALLLGGMAAVMHARTVLLRQRQRELQVLVEQRTEQLQASQRQLEQLAYFDPLTELGNRRLFSDELRRLLSTHQRDGGRFALLLIDLNRFKPINDTYGHDAGDAVLVAVARRLQQAVREADRVARLGGDEFGVLLEGTDSEAAVSAAKRRIAEALAPPIIHAGRSLHVSASLGAAVFPQEGVDCDTLFKAADTAMYRAKHRTESGAPQEMGALVAHGTSAGDGGGVGPPELV